MHDGPIDTILSELVMGTVLPRSSVTVIDGEALLFQTIPAMADIVKRATVIKPVYLVFMSVHHEICWLDNPTNNISISKNNSLTNQAL